MEHYFKENENIKHEIKTIEYYFKNRVYKFTTDAGIFSHEHIDPATDLLLRNIPALDGSLLDMGCGYGCIGIVLGKTYGLELTQCDVNPRAAELTEINCALNGVKSNVIVSDCYENITGKFDTIIINPPIHAGKAVTYKMYEDSAPRLNENGRLFVVTLKKHGAESTHTKLLKEFNNCGIIYKKKGFYIFCCTK